MLSHSPHRLNNNARANHDFLVLYLYLLLADEEGEREGVHIANPMTLPFYLLPVGLPHRVFHTPRTITTDSFSCRYNPL